MQDYNEISVATFDKHAARYAEKYFSLRDYDAYYAWISDEIAQTPYRFLDLACGPGNVAAFIQERHPQVEILCVDRSSQMLAEVQKRLTNVAVLAADCRDLHAVHGRFHAAAFFFGLSYFDDADASRVLRELHRLLLPDASMLLASVAGDPTLTGEQTNATGDRIFSFYRHQDAIERLIQEAGFTVLRSATIPSPANATVQSSDAVILARRQ